MANSEAILSLPGAAAGHDPQLFGRGAWAARARQTAADRVSWSSSSGAPSAAGHACAPSRPARAGEVGSKKSALSIAAGGAENGHAAVSRRRAWIAAKDRRLPARATQRRGRANSRASVAAQAK